MNLLNLAQATSAVQSGEIIAYPTEAVFGLGCDPLCADAMSTLRALKERDAEKGFLCIASHWQQIADWVLPLPHSTMETIFATWPGPNTWIFPASRHAPEACVVNNTIAVRVTAHPVVIALCNALGAALVSTSANPAGLSPARSVEEVDAYFGKKIFGILPGDVNKTAMPSRIWDAVSGGIMR